MNARDIKNLILIRNVIFLKFSIFVVNLPIIGDLYDMFYFKIINIKLKKSNINMIIETNNTCNLKCIMCQYQKMKREKVTMSFDFFRSIINQAVEMGCNNFQLQHYNEPLTDESIFEKINYLNSKNAQVILYSNATLLTDENINKILKIPPSVIRFSVDGYSKEVYEDIRKGAIYKSVVNGIIKLFEERKKRKLYLPRIEVYFVILEKNKHEMIEFKKFWKDKCDYVSFYPADSRYSSKFSLMNYRKLKPYPCFNPKIIIILSNGKVGLCCMDVNGEENLGDLNEKTLYEIVTFEKRKKIFASHMNRNCDIPLCLNCSKLYIDSAFTWWNF